MTTFYQELKGFLKKMADKWSNPFVDDAIRLRRMQIDLQERINDKVWGKTNERR